MRKFVIITCGLALTAAGLVRAAEPAAAPRPVPLTRPEVKQYL